MLTYFAIGFAIGVVTCIPIGVANVAVIDAAYRHNVLRAIAVGAGGAIADGLYSSLGIFGVARVLERNPTVPYILYGVSGMILLGYGLMILRAPPMPLATEERTTTTTSQHLGQGFMVGIAATLLNPSAVITWVVIVGSYATGVSFLGGLGWVIGIVLGSFGWFIVVAYLAHHGKRILSGKAIWMTRIAGLLVAGYGVFSLGRAGRYLFAYAL